MTSGLFDLSEGQGAVRPGALSTMSARVVKDSVSEDGARITTVACVYQRFIHAEVMTHRMFSRNAASSRAIPVRKMIARVRENPAVPLFWAKNTKGMVAHEEVDEQTRVACLDRWLEDAERACESAEFYAGKGLHKQIANRPLEPYQYITTLITATQWGNHKKLRVHTAAQQEYQHLATLIEEAREASVPTLVPHSGWAWHLPFETEEDWQHHITPEILQMCVARAARVSLFNTDGVYDPKGDLKLFERLAQDRPPHSSPFEHVARPHPYPEKFVDNFKGWMSYRRVFETSIGWDSKS